MYKKSILIWLILACMMVSVAYAENHSVFISSGVLSEYLFDVDDNSFQEDTSGRGTNITDIFGNMVYNSSCIIGGCYESYGGTGNYMKINYTNASWFEFLEVNKSYTIEFFGQTKDINTQLTFMRRDASFIGRSQSISKFQFYQYEGSYQVLEGGWNVNPWHHVVMSVNATHQLLWIYTVLYIRATTSFMSGSSNDLYLFAETNGNDVSGIRKIDNLRFYNVSFNQSIVDYMYNGGNGRVLSYEIPPVQIYISNQSINDSDVRFNDDIYFSADVTGGINAINCNLYHNNSGNFVNQGNASNISTNYDFIETETWTTNGLIGYYFNCTDGIVIKIEDIDTFKIQNIPSIINLIGVNNSGGNFSIYDNVDLEYFYGYWDWQIIATDVEGINQISYSWYNSSFDLMQNNVTFIPQIIRTNVSNFRDFEANPYNFTIIVTDNYGNITQQSISFNITDNDPPVCSGISNIEVSNSTNYEFNMTCVDDGLFSLNMTCDNSFSMSIEGLDLDSYSLIDTYQINQSTTCAYESCDGHTKNKIKEMDVGIDGNLTTFTFDNKISIRNNEEKNNMKTNYKEDRYEFEIETKQKKSYIEFTITSNEYIHIMDQSKYYGWIVTEDYWIDFMEDDVILSRIDRINNNEVLVKLTFNDNKDSFKFHSIGKLNCDSGTFNITLTTEPTPVGLGIISESVCPLDNDLSFVIGFFAIICMLFIIVAFNEMWFKMPFVTFAVGLAFVMLSVSINACSSMLALPFVVFGVLLWVYELSASYRPW